VLVWFIPYVFNVHVYSMENHEMRLILVEITDNAVFNNKAYPRGERFFVTINTQMGKTSLFSTSGKFLSYFQGYWFDFDSNLFKEVKQIYGD
jgi:hypothetical protein